MSKSIDPNNLIDPSWLQHKEFDALLRRVRNLRDSRQPLEGDFYRFVEPTWSGEADLLSGMGAKQYGGRWNPVGLAVVYGSQTPIGAAEESFRQAERHGFKAEQISPRIIFAFRVKLKIVLDLTRGQVRQRLRISCKRMIECDWQQSRKPPAHEQLTQAIGRAAAGAGFEAVLVPSKESEIPNLAIFPDFLRDSNALKLINSDKTQ